MRPWGFVWVVFTVFWSGGRWYLDAGRGPGTLYPLMLDTSKREESARSRHLIHCPSRSGEYTVLLEDGLPNHPIHGASANA
ncbi:uncharacterized protein BJX67DRAFT_352969 [Aspergillus lucknowensis]|uniref:Secreted protein n=1 Tax=Aspergillus lucknowensis TaxID=176173 RepID=A0ABR4LS46_9EURO